MEGGNEEAEKQRLLPSPPPYLFERLAHLPGYTWETQLSPFHSVFALLELTQCLADVVHRHTTIGMYLDIGMFIRNLPPPRLMTQEQRKRAPPRALQDSDRTAHLFDNMRPVV